MTFQVTKEEGLALRKACLGNARRVVVKVGSAILTKTDGLDQEVMENLAAELFNLSETGREVILVSSGAVAAGRKRLGLTGKFNSLKEKQAAAAVGQSSLMRAYEDIFIRFGKKGAQILLTHDDFSERKRYLNVRNTLFTLLDWGIMPIINENDTVSVDELRFGDNDTLGAMVANLIDADVFICLTDVDGLFSGNPTADPEAHLIYTVAKVDRQVERMAGNVVGALGTGGMRSKILAAKMVAAKGGCSLIAPGREPRILSKLFAGEAFGTFFLSQAEKMQSRKHWIAYTLRPKGSLVIDDGACKALLAHGKSLLPSGIASVEGRFDVGDQVQCKDKDGMVVAVGLVNYAAAEIKKIKGKKTAQIEEILGYCDSDEIIHRDNLVICDTSKADEGEL